MVKAVITEINTVCSCGVGFEALEANMLKPIAPVAVKAFDMYELPEEQRAYMVLDFDPKEILGRKGLRTLDRPTKLLMVAIETKFKAQLEAQSEEDRPGLMVGTAFGSLSSIGNFITDSIRFGVHAVNPNLFGNTVINSPAGNANIRYGLKNLSGTMSTGFTSGLESLIYSCDHIVQGYLDTILCAGLEEASVYQFVGTQVEGCLSGSGDMRPFGSDADGFVLGEGVALAQIENPEIAEARGARVLASIDGYASGFDPNGGKVGFNPTGEVAEAVVRQALVDAGIEASDISFVAASANGSKNGDAMEAAVLLRVFGKETPVVCYKSQFGETWGAAGMLSVAAVIADFSNERLSPVFGDYLLATDLDIVRGEVRVCTGEYALITSFSPDGNCAAVVLKKG